ncbi:MAG: type II toxin-antitoxin system VapC family toxin [Candidatus Verstraetearchaeota archaeon]|nr:type II toxin-antitoxin system VapC family toxin [Candidatus Verstraetearchaeota archaeon]
MPRVVVDASVVIKWFVEEEGSEEALAIRDGYIEGEFEIAAPELLLFEVMNSLRYKGLFTVTELKGISEALEAFSFDLYSLRGDCARRAVEIADENNITIYDASYIALAMMERAEFYTADEKLLGRLKKRYREFAKGLEGRTTGSSKEGT